MDEGRHTRPTNHQHRSHGLPDHAPHNETILSPRISSPHTPGCHPPILYPYVSLRPALIRQPLRRLRHPTSSSASSYRKVIRPAVKMVVVRRKSGSHSRKRSTPSFLLEGASIGTFVSRDTVTCLNSGRGFSVSHFCISAESTQTPNAPYTAVTLAFFCGDT